jgi:hypothetical protein
MQLHACTVLKILYLFHGFIIHADVIMSWLGGALSNVTILIFLKYACVMASAKLDIAK